jgi:hypothetical protein
VQALSPWEQEVKWWGWAVLGGRKGETAEGRQPLSVRSDVPCPRPQHFLPSARPLFTAREPSVPRRPSEGESEESRMCVCVHSCAVASLRHN